MSTPLQDFVKHALTLQGHDGLCDGAGCGCGLADFAPCGEGPFGDCSPARGLLVPADGVLIDPQDGRPVHHDGKPGDIVFLFA